MAGSRTRTRRRIPGDAAIVCAGHQELRDIVIRTDENVEIIKKSLEKGSATMEEHDQRIGILETAEAIRVKAEEQKQKSKNEKNSIFNNRAVVASIIIAAASVLVAVVALFW